MNILCWVDRIFVVVVVDKVMMALFVVVYSGAKA